MNSDPRPLLGEWTKALGIFWLFLLACWLRGWRWLRFSVPWRFEVGNAIATLEWSWSFA